jgi:hypothetical protein
MRKFNLEELILLPLIILGALFAPVKWISLGCFLFIATMLPVLYWTERLKKAEPKSRYNMGGFIGGIILLVLECFIVYGYMRIRPFDL